MKITTLAKLSSAPAVIAAALLTTPAFAQDAPDTTEEVAEEDVIIVTGTLVRNPNLVAASPVNVVGEAEIGLRQATNAEELIGELPGVAPGINSAVNNGSNGTASLNLRRLGTNRNLVLLDGTRIVPSTVGGVTDLNVIPVALVERVEIVTGGASSVYGADAIAGVANFVLKRDFAGVDATATYGITEEGDGERLRGDLTVGANFDDGRGNAVLSVGYQDTKPVFQGDRSFGQDTLFVNGASIGSGTSVPTRITGVSGGTPGTIQYDPDTGTLVPTYNSFNFAPFNYFQTPLKRFNIFGQANYEVVPQAEVYVRGMYTKSEVQLRLAPSGLFGDTWQFPLNNPFINETIRQQICAAPTVAIDAATCTAAGAATDPTDPNYLEVPVTINRRLVEQGARERDLTTNQFQIWAGVRGDITSDIGYDLYVTHGESDRSQTNLNWGLKSRLQQALRAVDAETCVDQSNGCFPINLFGPTGEDIDQRSVDFFNQPAGNVVKTHLTVANLTISGDVGNFLWASEPIGFAVGGQYRDYGASQVSDVAFGTQDEVLGTGAPSPSFSGGYDVREAFAELIVPVISDVPGFYNLTLEGGIRISDYSNTGTSTTWKAGGSWEPFEGYRLRGVYQHAVRSPNIGELFLPVTTGLTALAFDPCQGANPVGNAQLTAICIAQGAPASTIGNIPAPSAAQINATSGGNPNLDVETANTYTIGAIVTPPELPGFALSVDYFNIELTDAITTVSPDDVINPCFDDFDPEACALIGRNPLNGSLNGGGDTLGLILQLTNAGTIKTDGIDLRTNYRHQTGFGAISLNFNGTWTKSFEFLGRDCLDNYSNNCEPIVPEFAFNTRLTASIGDIADISILWTWLDAVQYEEFGDPDVLEEYQSIPSFSYFDLTGRVKVTESIELTASVFNVFDKKPPIVSSFIGSSTFNSGNTYPTTYDVLGRRYSVTARLRF